MENTNTTFNPQKYQKIYRQHGFEVLESFIDLTTDAVLFFSFDGYIFKVNRTFEQMFGWTSDEVIGFHLSNLPWIPSEDIEKVFYHWDRTVKGIDLYQEEYVRITKSGKPLNVVMSIVPIELIRGYAVIMKNITFLKEAQQSLLQSEKLSAAGQLAAGIAHEIRNPLTVIKGFIQIMTENLESNSNVSIMLSELERVEHIIDELLLLSKPHSTEVKIENLRQIIASVVYLLEPQATMKNIFFETDISAYIPWIQCTAELKQVFINIIKNAIEACSPHGRISITIKPAENQTILVEITDNGVGIPNELLQRIGEPFVTTKSSGTGLGLMMSKKIIADHNGSIGFTSVVGKGTIVQIILPHIEPK